MTKFVETITYDHHFNGNEWFVLIGLCVGVFATFVLPHRFSRKLSTLYFMCGITFGGFFDLTLGVIPVSFYDTGDSSAYEFSDLLSIVSYGPYSYLFFYIYDLLKLRIKFIPLYILFWTLMSLGMEWLGVNVGEFHYAHGYGLQVSFVIYLMVHSLWILFSHIMKPRATSS